MIDAPASWGGQDLAPDLKFTPLSQIVERPIVWIDFPFLQGSAFHLLAGIKNAGKGTLLAHHAARFTRGELGPKRHVLWMALGEDSYGIDVRPRVRAAGGDIAAVSVLEGYGFQLPEHGQMLEDAIREHEAGLVVIDPLGAVMAGGKSTNDDSHVRPVLQALNYMADVTETILIGVRHISIKTGARQQGALAAILGSSDWVNIPRAVLALVHDDVDANMRHLFTITGNRGPSDTAGVMCSIEGVVLDGHDHAVTNLRMLGESNKDPDELLAVKRTRRTSRSDAARLVLVRVLNEIEGGSLESDLLDAEGARRCGLSARTVRNVRMELRDQGYVRAVPVKDADGNVLHWLTVLTLAGIALASEASEASTSSLSRELRAIPRANTPVGQDSGVLQRKIPQSPPEIEGLWSFAGETQESPANGHNPFSPPESSRVPTSPISQDSGDLQGNHESRPDNGHVTPKPLPEWERLWHERHGEG